MGVGLNRMPSAAVLEAAGQTVTQGLLEESVSDYSSYDFRRLWSGREKVSEVERIIVERSLRTMDPRRVLEVGTGFGRLLGAVRAVARETVASDYDAGALARLDLSSGAGGTVLRVAANVQHLPFVDGAFTSATMIRVHHHLADPARALAELRRVLRPGATLLVSYSPRPSVGTLVRDVQRALRSGGDDAVGSVTFARTDRVALPPDPFPVYVGSRACFDGDARSAGLESAGELGAGFEEYSPMRRLPARLFVGVAAALGSAPGFPTRFARLRVPGESTGEPPALERILACPRCAEPLGFPGSEGAVRCARCGPVGAKVGAVVDLRHSPEGSRRYVAGAPARVVSS